MWEWKIAVLALKIFIAGIAAMGCYLFFTEQFIMGIINLIVLGLFVGFSPIGRWKNIWSGTVMIND